MLTAIMLRRILYQPILLLLAGCLSAGAQRQAAATGVLVVGGGAGGTAAGLQAARMGVPVIIAEPTGWLGGMITAAGVSAFDGNHNMPSGIWAELRQRLYTVYGGPSGVATGWVSNTLFEPHTGDSILKAMAAEVPLLRVLYHLRFEKILMQGSTVKGAVFYDEKNKREIAVYAKQVIDATELGDVMAAAGVPFDVGMEAAALTGENVNIPQSNSIIQDMTYVAILKDYGPGADKTIARPAAYDSMEFDGCCNEFCSRPEKLASNVTAKKMLEYGKLPNGKYMINWPGKGNDIYLNIIPLTHARRQQQLQKAKAKTMRFVYFLQKQLGFKQLALANDEFGTADGLPLIPYHRESRRLQGLVRFKVQHIAEPFSQPEALYRTGVAVGDYPIDHHHRENTAAPQHLGFYPVPSFNFPLGALIPRRHNGLVVAEKSTSISNVVNGTTRLQPIVMLTGQAAGALAALAVKKGIQPRQVSIRQVQAALLRAGAYIMPYYDVKPTHPHFTAIQKTGATGILRGRGEPYQWANRTWFYPDSVVNSAALLKDAAPFLSAPFPQVLTNPLTIEDAVMVTKLMNAADSTVETNAARWSSWGLKDYNAKRSITRAELAVLLNNTVRPFEQKEPDHNGNFTSHYQPKRKNK